MPNALADSANAIVSARRGTDTIEFGPWLGSMRSVSADMVPRDFIAGGSNYLHTPRTRGWKRRGGQTIQFDTFAGSVGLLPASWDGRCRLMEEFAGDNASDGIPTVCALVTKEQNDSANVLDDGKFSNFYVRDQVLDTNYTLGSEFSATTYPSVGTLQTHRYTPLWHESGDGGLTRGVTEFARRLLVSGSRKFLKSGRHTYHPSRYGTPSRQAAAAAGATEASEGAALFATSPSANVEATQNAAGFGWASTGTIPPANDIWTLSDNEPGGVQNAVGALNTDGGGSASLKAGIFVNNYNGAARNDPFGRLTFATLSSAISRWRVTMKVQLCQAGTGTYTGLAELGVRLALNNGTYYEPAKLVINTLNQIPTGPGEGTFQTITFDIDTASTPSGAQTDNTLNIQFYTGGVAFAPCLWIDYLYVSPLAGGVSGATYLTPSGPVPPTHAGVIVKGSIVAGSVAQNFFPDADTTDGAWLGYPGATNTDLFNFINEDDDSNYIQATTNTTGLFTMQDLGFAPQAGDYVALNLRFQHAQVGGSAPTLTASVLGVATSVASQAYSGGAPGTLNYQTIVFTDAQIAAMSVLTPTWAAVNLRFVTTGLEVGESFSIAYAALIYRPSGLLDGGWKGHDRFFYSVAYRFEDDSLWAPCTPRFPNDTLTNGYNLFTVDQANAEVGYDKVQWTKIPVPQFGIKDKALLRTPKINSATDDNLQLNPYDFRVVAFVGAEVTTYDDYFGDDDSLTLDPDGLFIRYDLAMPPRAREIRGGESRVIHQYGGQNPCAIRLAPVGRAADYDLNLADSDGTAYNTTGMYWRIASSNGVSSALHLSNDVVVTVSLSFTTYDTLEKLVDAINATNYATNAMQWRAQIVPGADPQAPTSALMSNSRTITACVVDNTAKTITKAGGGLSAIPVGAMIEDDAAATNAYVTAINSDTVLTYSGTVTTQTDDLVFYDDTGDGNANGLPLGQARVIAESHAGYLYFKTSYLDSFQPFDKAATWMTVATPGSAKAAPNMFTTKIENKHTPANSKAGKVIGGGFVKGESKAGFVIVHENEIGVVENTRDAGTGADADFHYRTLDANSGGCAPYGICEGTGFVIVPKPEGVYAYTLDQGFNLSEAIYKHPTSDDSDGVGDFDYELPACVASTAQDLDDAQLHARIMRSVLYVNYRNSGTHPDRQVQYDFSSGTDAGGIRTLFRAPGVPWGWSTELVRSVTCMAEGRRNTGSHLYGWNEQNAGSSGDGRIDEFETGDTDNGTAISGSVIVPWVKRPFYKVSGQELRADHLSPTASTTSLGFTRSYSLDSYAFTPTVTGSAIVTDDLKLLTSAARVQSQACYCSFGQTAGTASELRRLELKVKWFKRSY